MIQYIYLQTLELKYIGNIILFGPINAHMKIRVDLRKVCSNLMLRVVAITEKVLLVLRVLKVDMERICVSVTRSGWVRRG